MTLVVAPDTQYPGLYQVLTGEEEPGGVNYGVTVPDVAALAPHIAIGENPAAPADDVFTAQSNSVSMADVQGFIRNVAARVALRLGRMSRVKPDSPTAAVLYQAAHDVATNGAAHYLVGAAHPSEAGINNQSTYSGELWTRYTTGLDELSGMLDDLVENGGADVVPVDPGSANLHRGTGNFPPPIFTDGLRW